ncbi:hypothetical protein AVEN_266633-1, partial [Araneus ventricosus]
MTRPIIWVIEKRPGCVHLRDRATPILAGEDGTTPKNPTSHHTFALLKPSRIRCLLFSCPSSRWQMEGLKVPDK